ncbi:hypothetical protein PAXRUDRAFT_723189 [Paxillus rubicundulus Ve08.2h10]|uniref:Unplaced genomic scaffold scaffold_83, whole genome shotgun sequence n=1 Tax=Paxillus rubicundulus Ve08.2h10 TaxID=930991 RepID=A0A0D0DIH8_9AGAM|nr:hypothetical protein PAXRUDRAFT_723189 [Paxillus rubicundulus Ve08.2h10]
MEENVIRLWLQDQGQDPGWRRMSTECRVACSRSSWPQQVTIDPSRNSTADRSNVDRPEGCVRSSRRRRVSDTRRFRLASWLLGANGQGKPRP